MAPCLRTFVSCAMLTLAVNFLTASEAMASIIRWDFEVTLPVSDFVGVDPIVSEGGASAVLSPGSVVSGSVLFDSASADLQPDPNPRIFLADSFSLVVDGTQVMAATAFINVVNDQFRLAAPDSFAAFFTDDFGQDVVVRLSDGPSFLSSDQVPSIETLRAFSNAAFGVLGPGAGVNAGAVQSQFSVVPEPSAALLFFAVLAAGLARPRRRPAHRHCNTTRPRNLAIGGLLVFALSAGEVRAAMIGTVTFCENSEGVCSTNTGGGLASFGQSTAFFEFRASQPIARNYTIEIEVIADSAESWILDLASSLVGVLRVTDVHDQSPRDARGTVTLGDLPGSYIGPGALAGDLGFASSVEFVAPLDATGGFVNPVEHTSTAAIAGTGPQSALLSYAMNLDFDPGGFTICVATDFLGRCIDFLDVLPDRTSFELAHSIDGTLRRVPEPATIGLLGLALAGLLVQKRQKPWASSMEPTGLGGGLAGATARSLRLGTGARVACSSRPREEDA